MKLKKEQAEAIEIAVICGVVLTQLSFLTNVAESLPVGFEKTKLLISRAEEVFEKELDEVYLDILNNMIRIE